MHFFLYRKFKMDSAGARAGGNLSHWDLFVFCILSRELLFLCLSTGHIILGQSWKQWATTPTPQEGQRGIPLNSTPIAGI